MRVFKRYDFNVAPFCKFSETYQQLENFLRENGHDYKNALFKYEEFGLDTEKNSLGKILKKYPQTKHYLWFFQGNYESSIISNCGENWEPKDNKNSIELSRMLSTKIPRPFNPYETCFVLNNVDFFKRNTEQVSKKGIVRDFYRPLSSNISFSRGFTSGTKYNLVSMTIDVTDDETGRTILDDSGYVRAFKEYFNVDCYNTEMIICADELAPDETSKQEIEMIISETKKGFENWEGAEEKLGHSFQDDFMGNQYSFKKSISSLKRRKLLDYAYYKYAYSVYYLRKKDGYNNVVELEVVTAPTVRRIETFIKYKGIAFEYKFMTPSYTPYDQKEADRYLELLMQVIHNAEKKYFSRIAEFYPNSPDWLI